MTYEEKQDLKFLRILISSGKSIFSYTDLKTLLHPLVGNELHSTINALIAKGILVSETLLNSSDPLQRFPLGHTATGKIKYLKRRRRNDRISNVSLGITLLCGIIAAYCSAASYFKKDPQ